MNKPSCDPDIATQNFVPCFAYGPAYQYLNQADNQADKCKWSTNDKYNEPALTAIDDCGNITDSSKCNYYYLSEETENTGTDTYYPQCTWYNNECVKGDDSTYISEANTSNLCFIVSCNDDSPCSDGSKQTCVGDRCVLPDNSA